MSSLPEAIEPEPETLRDTRAAYQGQPGSFGARAAARFGRPVAYATFEKTLRALEKGEVECATLPAVNRVAGAILEPLEALWRLVKGGTSLFVTGEIEVPVRFVLAAPRGVALEDVSEVHSQGAALRQCTNRLARLDAVPIETHDTAYAADRVAELGGSRAAISSEEAALAAGLVILLEDVSDVAPNATRFWRLERPENGALVPPLGAPRVVHFSGARLSAALTEAGAELLALPGLPEAPVRGFAVFPESKLDAASRVAPAAGESLAWLSAPPEFVRPPRMSAIPKVTAVAPPTRVTVGPFSVGAGARAVIAGPCAVESEEQVRRLARAVARAGATALRGGVFKPRTSPYSFQGHGLLALRWLKAAGDRSGRSPSSPTSSRSARATARTTTS